MYTPMSAYPSALSPSGFNSRNDYSIPFSSSSNRFRDTFLTSKKAGYRMPQKRSASVAPNYRSTFVPSASTRSFIREMFDDNSSINRRRNRSPSPYMSPQIAPRGRTRDDLIDSIIHTRTNEHRVMPGQIACSSWDERKANKVDCDKVYPGIIISNGETIQDIDYLKGAGVTHVLNTAERHVPVNPSKYPLHNINYYGFHVDDHPSSNIARYFTRTSEYMDDAISRGGTVCVNCAMGWSRSATVVAAYLVNKKGMSSTQALETIRRNRPIRPNPGFLKQLANYDNMIGKRMVWD